MLKTILKEAGIIILLLFAISLTLGVLLYDYIPTAKTVPSKVAAYTRPNTISEELNKTVANGQNIIKTYQLDAADLKLYESTNSYDSGKVNPFGDITTNNTATNINTSSSQTNTNKQNNSNNTSGGFFNTVGK